MRKIAYILLSFFVFMLLMPLALFMAPARATDAGACYNIGDADARTYCLARARKDVSQCYAVQRSDLRAQCLAEVRK